MTKKITKENHIPLYLQVITMIMDEIRMGNWVEGSKLPTEKELCNQFGVSLITIRSALKELNSEGVIFKIQGKGSYISNNQSQKYDLKFHQLRSFTEEMAQENKNAGAILLSEKLSQASAEDILMFKLDVEDLIRVVKRVRTVDGLPTHISTHRIPQKIVQRFTDVDFTHSIYKLFEKAGMSITKGTEEISAIIPRASEAEVLGINTKQPVIESISIASCNGLPVMMTRSLINSNRLKIKLDLVP